MIEVELAETTWYVTTRRYPTERMALDAWELLNRQMMNPRLETGIYRYGTTEAPGTHVTAVSHLRESVERAERALPRGGKEVELNRETTEAMILRRMRVVVGHGPGPGETVIRRGLRAGATLLPDGTMVEPVNEG